MPLYKITLQNDETLVIDATYNSLESFKEEVERVKRRGFIEMNIKGTQINPALIKDISKVDNY